KDTAVHSDNPPPTAGGGEPALQKQGYRILSHDNARFSERHDLAIGQSKNREQIAGHLRQKARAIRGNRNRSQRSRARIGRKLQRPLLFPAFEIEDCDRPEAPDKENLFVAREQKGVDALESLYDSGVARL